ncbi:hypothetical protein [Sorangium sp. So ce1099]|uniref:hypothetical protein n=1 Tax=Sorangium sp. So ce1099 TaxID=3133331 RepID=UPI003F626066
MNRSVDPKHKAKRTSSTLKANSRQQDLFVPSHEDSLFSSNECRIVSVGKRRDGGTRYWCLQHKADATAKYGRPAENCRYSHIPPIKSDEILALDVSQYAGGIALWGAVPPVYDTTLQPLDRGIHVHARRSSGGHKEIDATYRSVRLLVGIKDLPKQELVISELDAIYYMVTSVFGYSMKYVECLHCGHPHLDKDWFSVHAHRSHLCAGCGKHFRDSDVAIGNPICKVRSVLGVRAQKPKTSKKQINLRQADYPGGIQVWGSNPAVVWTSKHSEEEEGVHVHAFREDGALAALDDTFSRVTVDGIALDPLMVRTLMAQSALPHISNRVIAINCASCGTSAFDAGEHAFTPKTQRRCENCGNESFETGRLRKVVGNPLVEILERLADRAPRPPQMHSLDLLPETL